MKKLGLIVWMVGIMVIIISYVIDGNTKWAEAKKRHDGLEATSVPRPQ